MNLPSNHRDTDSSKTVELMYLELLRRFDNGKSLKLMDPIEDMEIEFDAEQDDLDIHELVKAQEKVKEELSKPELAALSKAQIEEYKQKDGLKTEILDIEQQLKNATKMIMTEDLVNMKRVMRRMELIDANDVPKLKGKVAAGISAADEILTTELLFSGFFQDLTPDQIAAVLSCLIYTDGNSEGEPPKEEELQLPFKGLLEIADKVANIMIESNIELNKEDYLQKFAPEMMLITMKWCQGARFVEICEISDKIYEGSIIRALRRLDELISQLVEAAKIIGNNELRDKFMASQKNLKRGIVFTASLYL